MIDIRKTARNILVAVITGDLLMRMRFDRFFVHLVYVFVLIWFMIYFSLKVDQTLVRMERNRVELDNLKIYHAQKTSELAGYDRLSTIEALLQKSGSDLSIPEKPACRISK